MKQIEKSEKIDIIEEIPKFRGYTIEEIRYQRALLALRKEFCKAKVMESVQNLKPGSNSSTRNSSKGGSSKWAVAGKVASKLLSNLNTIDYALMGLSLIGTVRKGYRLIRGKKKK